jgi:hypothetical protein
MSKPKITLGACAGQMANYLAELTNMRETAAAQQIECTSRKASLEAELIALKARLDVVNSNLHLVELEQKRADATEVEERLQEAARLFESVQPK